MKPRTSLVISIVILIVAFIGARLYVGQQLEKLANKSSPHRQIATPKVNVVPPPPAPTPAPAAPPPSAPDPAAAAEEELANTLSAFTGLIEFTGEGRSEYANQLLTDLNALLATKKIEAVAEASREDIRIDMDLIAEQIPDDPDMRSIKDGYRKAQKAILKRWKM